MTLNVAEIPIPVILVNPTADEPGRLVYLPADICCMALIGPLANDTVNTRYLAFSPMPPFSSKISPTLKPAPGALIEIVSTLNTGTPTKPVPESGDSSIFVKVQTPAPLLNVNSFL